nr:uncharacterized protein LOC111515848 [Leptinotarsa decemlineata]
MLLSKTKLRQEHKLKLRNFITVRKDRPDALRSSGVAILIRKGIAHTQIPQQRSSLEHVDVQLADGTCVFAVYNKPDGRFTSHDLDNLCNVGNKVLVVGDLNARRREWNCHNRPNTDGKTLLEYSLNNNIVIEYPEEPTHYPWNGTSPSRIDLVLNKNVRDLGELVTVDELSSDHCPVLFSLNRDRPTTKRVKYDYKSTDWSEYKASMNNLTVIKSNIDKDDINEICEQFVQNIRRSRYVSTRKVVVEGDRDILPIDIVELIRQKHRIRKDWQRTRDPRSKDQMLQMLQRLTSA